MVKNSKGKDDVPHPNSIPNREIFQRLNFLYQASAYLQSIRGPTNAKDEEKELGAVTSTKEKGKKRRRVVTLGDVGSSYVHCMRAIGRKTVVRMDPSVKRTICKRCDTILSPGTTASVRVKGSSSRGKRMVYTCLSCNTSRAIPAPPNTPSPATVLETVPAPLTAEPLPDSLGTPNAPLMPTTQLSNRCKKRKKRLVRPLPLFARPDAGHVIYKGNEIVEAVE